MHLSRALWAGLLVLVGMGAAPAAALAASDPVIQSTQESSAPDGGGRMLLVYGQNLQKVLSFELDQSNGTLIANLPVIFKSKTLVGLSLPASLVSPTYTLPGNFSLKFATKTTTDSVLVFLYGGNLVDGSVGATKLDGALLTDLDTANSAAHADLADLANLASNALAVGGQTLAALHSAALLTGTIPTGNFSAYDDLVAEGKIGSASNQVAVGNHNHNALYPLRTDLNTPGTINTGSNPVQWSQLVGVPGGLADGIDDTGASSYSAGAGLTLTTGVFAVSFAGTGSATTVARSDHNHDTSYYTQAQLNAAGGTINTGSNPVDWSRLKGVPAVFADGTDDGASYTAGTGLTLTTTVFSASFGTTSTTVAAGNHTHSIYVPFTGGGSVTSTSSSTTVGGLDVVTSNGIGIAGHGNYGVLGDCDSNGSFGVWGKASNGSQSAVYASNSGSSGYGIRVNKSGNYGYAAYLRSTGRYTGGLRMYVSYRYTTALRISAYGRSSTSVYVRAGQYSTGVRSYAGYRGTGGDFGAYGNYCTGLTSRAYGYGSYALRLNIGRTRNGFLMRYYGSNQVRFDYKGRGYFNGGTYSSGADFAESVKVDQPAREFEPGDVMVIDVKAPRQFALSKDANSTLVAGVVSTKPAVVGSLHNVAGPDGARRLKDEVKLGIVGIVPTKVCDEGGEIKIGDLLVSSSKPGHAMKAPAVPAVGTVIGKALGALDRGTGKIEVLLIAR